MPTSPTYLIFFDDGSIEHIRHLRPEDISYWDTSDCTIIELRADGTTALFTGAPGAMDPITLKEHSTNATA